jgi:SSS family solute:Na+ symporter
VFALLFAFLLAKRIRSARHLTIPDLFEAVYDRRTALLGGVLTFLLITPAAYVLMLGVLVQLVLGWSLPVSIVVTTFITVVYLWWGGFRSDVWANAFEFVMMFLGFALIVGFAFWQYGGWEFISSRVPPLHLTWHGGNSWQFIFVWFFIALWTLVDPSFHQRCAAAKDEETARRGILVSILFWFVFDFMTSMAGLYARALQPALAEPMFAYPMLAEVTLPALAKGLFYVGLLATIMSTLSSLTLISGITVGKDIVGRWRGMGMDDPAVREWTRWGIVAASAVSVVLALAVPSVVRLWYIIGTCIIPGLLVPVLAGYVERLRISAPFAFASMIAGWLLSTASLIDGQLNMVSGVPQYWLGIEPMYPGLIAAVMIWGMGKAVGRFQGSGFRFQ